MNFNIDKFNIKNINSGAGINIIGRRASGKTTLVRDIISNIRKKFNFKNGLIISNEKKKYYDYFDVGIFLNAYNDKLVDNFFNLIAYKKPPESLLVLENCDFIRTNKHFREKLSGILFNKKHMHLLSIFTTTYFRVRPEHRYHIEYFFIFKDLPITHRKDIYDCYFTKSKLFKNFLDFDKFIDSFYENNDYKCLVIENDLDNSNIYWYKAEIKK